MKRRPPASPPSFSRNRAQRIHRTAFIFDRKALAATPGPYAESAQAPTGFPSRSSDHAIRFCEPQGSAVPPIFLKKKIGSPAAR